MFPIQRSSWVLLLILVAAATTPAQELTTDEIRTAAQNAWSDQNWEKCALLYRALVKAAPEDATAWHHLGYSLHALGRLDEALRAHQAAAELPDPAIRATALYNAACVYALKADKDAAFAWLAKAVAAGFTNAEHVAQDPDMTNLRGDPRLGELVARMKGVPEGGSIDARVFPQTTPRLRARLFYFARAGSPGQVSIEYSQPEWKESYEEMVGSPKFMGRRWRLGKDFWTTCDTSIPLQVSGVAVPAGYYYLVLIQKAKGDFALVFLDPVGVRKRKLDGFQAELTTGGIEVPLQHVELDRVADELRIKLAIDADNNTRGTLGIEFGPHRLTAPLKMRFAVE